MTEAEAREMALSMMARSMYDSWATRTHGATRETWPQAGPAVHEIWLGIAQDALDFLTPSEGTEETQDRSSEEK